MKSTALSHDLPGARGLKNMHYRASQIGAELTVAAQTPPLKGCRVVLRLPLVV